MQFSNTQISASQPVFSPCSSYFVVLSNNNAYIKQACLELKNYSQIALKQSKNNDSKNLQYPIPKFSPDSKFIALQFKKKIEIYDLQGHLKIRIRDDGDVEGMLWSSDSKQIIGFFSNSFYCNIYNIYTQAQYYIKNSKLCNENGVAFSKSQNPENQGNLVAILQKHNGKDCIGIYFIQNWQLVNHIVLQSYDACKIQFSPNGYIIVYQNKINFKVYFVDIIRATVQSYGSKDYVMGVSCSKLSNIANLLVLGVYDDCIHIINMLSWKLIAEIQISAQIDLKNIMFIRQQNQGNFSQVEEAKLKKIVGIKKQIQNREPPAISILQFSPNDNFLAIKHDNYPNYVFIFSIKRLELFSILQYSNHVRDLKWLYNEQNQSILCIATGKSTLSIWRDNENILFQIQIPKKPNNQLNPTKIQLGKKGRILFYSSSSKRYAYATHWQQFSHSY